MISDNEIIELLFSRSEKAVAQIKEKYGRMCRSISYNILHNSEDSEECENDAYLKIWNTIPPNRPDNLCAYILRIVRSAAIDKLRYNSRRCRSGETDALLSELNECIPASDNTELSADDSLKHSINDFLSDLSETPRAVFMRRYFYCDSIKDIANRFSISETNVTSILTRTRKKLKQQLISDGITF